LLQIEYIYILNDETFLCSAASKNDESNESNTLFYPYMTVEDTHNIVMLPCDDGDFEHHV
jgi:hypothetical protein